MQILGCPKSYNAQSSKYHDDKECYDSNAAIAFVESLMWIFLKADLDTGGMDALLGEDLDCALSAYHRQLHPSSPELHWSIRWTKWRGCSSTHKMLRPHDRDTGITRVNSFLDQPYDIIYPTKNIYLELGTRLPSSPRNNPGDRLYGAAIKLKRFRTATIEWNQLSSGARLEIFNAIPANFAQYAANYGLFCYVFKLLEKPPKVYTAEALNDLLLVAIGSLLDFGPAKICTHRIYAAAGGRTPFPLISELLRMGSNPQSCVKGFSASIWGYYLMQLVASSFESCTDDFREAAARTTKQFLLHGSDRQEKLLVQMEIRLHGLEELHTGPLLGSREHYYDIIYFGWHNVMSVIEELFRNTSEYESLRQLYLKRALKSLC